MTTVDGGMGVQVGTGKMRVDWQEPVTLHIHPDVTDAQAGQLRRSAGDAVQLLIGHDMTVHAWVLDAAGPVPVGPGQVVERVTSIELDTAALDDDTVLNVDRVTSGTASSLPSLTREGNDVDDTILGQPPVSVAADDPNASADTVIGERRRVPAAAPDSVLPPPPLPSIPGIPASAHLSAGVTPTGARRTRIEQPDASGPAAAPHAVSFPDGRVIALDRAVYVGRSPRSPRITSGLVPELVAVPSPRREVSATHLEILEEGRAVVVRDLGSTNGTRVSSPGAAPSLLGPGSSRVVAAGTMLDLGDGIVLEIVAGTDGAEW
jgi:hypothetical protein